jgi:hypothetical protein
VFEKVVEPLETELPVGRLPAALTLRESGFFGREVHWRAGEHFMDVAAHDAAAIGAVPITFYDHRATTLRARLGWGFLQSRHRDPS